MAEYNPVSEYQEANETLADRFDNVMTDIAHGIIGLATAGGVLRATPAIAVSFGVGVGEAAVIAGVGGIVVNAVATEAWDAYRDYNREKYGAEVIKSDKGPGSMPGYSFDMGTKDDDNDGSFSYVFNGVAVTYNPGGPVCDLDMIDKVGRDDYWMGCNTSENKFEGRNGNDWLFGLDKADRLIGGNGKDWLDGGAGFDRLTGGAGADRFDFGPREGEDIIFDFRPNQDGDKLVSEWDDTTSISTHFEMRNGIKTEFLDAMKNNHGDEIRFGEAMPEPLHIPQDKGGWNFANVNYAIDHVWNYDA